MATAALQQVGEYHTLMGAAVALNTTYWAVYQYVRRHQIPTVTIGRATLVKLADLEGIKRA